VGHRIDEKRGKERADREIVDEKGGILAKRSRREKNYEKQTLDSSEGEKDQGRKETCTKAVTTTLKKREAMWELQRSAGSGPAAQGEKKHETAKGPKKQGAKKKEGGKIDQFPETARGPRGKGGRGGRDSLRRVGKKRFSLTRKKRETLNLSLRGRLQSQGDNGGA